MRGWPPQRVHPLHRVCSPRSSAPPAPGAKAGASNAMLWSDVAAAAQDTLRTLLLQPSPQACEPQPCPSKPAFVAQCFHEAPPPFQAWPRAPHAHGPARQRRFLACHPAIHRCQDFPSHRNQDLEMGLHGSGSGGQCELPRWQRGIGLGSSGGGVCTERCAALRVRDGAAKGAG